MIHGKRNKRQRAERIRLQTAMRKVLKRREGIRLRDKEVTRYSNSNHHPWSGFLKRESNFHSDEVYNLDVTAVLFIAPRLRLLIKGGFEKCGATPNWFDDRLGHLDWEQWFAVLKKMQFAFDTLEQSIDETGLYDLSELTVEQKEGINEGLELFGKYMLYLTV